MPRKIFGWALVATLVLYVIQNPGEAAITTKAIGSGLADGATGVGNFVVALTTGPSQPASLQP
ncbi:MAG TPA: hypothetical protein VK453_26930 [Micromonosporaceae bacterium]|nr:hypothetical protein [Micromonosporaceae bacterium]